MNNLKSDFGYTYQTGKVIVFFGNQNGTFSNIEIQFPDLNFEKIKQTHSDIIVSASGTIVEADAHFTALRKTALLISTADCLPVLIHCKQTDRVAAVHAGWRGVANQIVLKTLRTLIASGSKEKVFEIWIGPHILQNSFEVESDVLKQLEVATYQISRSDYCFEKNDKHYVDLKKIVCSQIAEIAGSQPDIHCLEHDTKTKTEFCSFRRDKEKAARNLSFIVLK